MKRYRNTLIISLLLSIFLLGFAQEPPAPPPKPPMGGEESLPPEEEEPIEKIETIRLWQLTEELKLTEEQAAKLFPKFRSLRELRKEAEKSRIEKISELAELLAKKAKDDVLKKKIEEVKEVEKRFRDREEALRKEIEAILSTEQFARFLIFQERFERRIRGMIRKMRGRR
jgi:Spy/CpxP family protein refolding chaperone|uniref:Periplasmic heavy metal sensor n=1 Tax=candidate division WOR-3 bacterium TaxID=2052148 RepID=A0A7C3UPS0_UNCW3